MTTSFSLTYGQITACAERQMSLYSERAAVLTLAAAQRRARLSRAPFADDEHPFHATFVSMV
jgi:hypothetical protein